MKSLKLLKPVDSRFEKMNIYYINFFKWAQVLWAQVLWAQVHQGLTLKSLLGLKKVADSTSTMSHLLHEKRRIIKRTPFKKTAKNNL